MEFHFKNKDLKEGDSVSARSFVEYAIKLKSFCLNSLKALNVK